jgi:hypothetical protein
MKAKEYNIHSQYGEDGVINHILDTIGVTEGYFVEFGAWDGIYMSNTCLLAEKGWEGIFIEASKEKFEILMKNHNNPRLELINAFVEVNGKYSLDNIINRSKFKGKDPILLSIDIDSDDLAIWMSLKEYRPNIVIIEYNLTIPPDVVFINPRGQQIGNSAKAIYEFAKNNNYILVHQTEGNMIFFDNKFDGHNFCELDFIQAQRLNCIRYFFGYDGSLYRCSISQGVQTIEENEIIPIPWTHALMSQPISLYFRKGQRNSILVYRSMMFFNILSTMIFSPIQFVKFIYKKRHGLVNYIRTLASRGT